MPPQSDWLTYRNVPAGGKYADVREVQSLTRKLAANTGDCAVGECAAPF